MYCSPHHCEAGFLSAHLWPCTVRQVIHSHSRSSCHVLTGLPGSYPKMEGYGQKARPLKGAERCEEQAGAWSGKVLRKRTFELRGFKMRIQKKLPRAAHSRQAGGQVSRPWRTDAQRDCQGRHFIGQCLAGQSTAPGKIGRGTQI